MVLALIDPASASKVIRGLALASVTIYDALSEFVLIERKPM